MLLTINLNCADMDNEPIRIQEPKPQPIFMKMAENLSEIIFNIENSLNSTLKKKVNGDLIQIYAIDINQYRFMQKYLSENNIDFYTVQSRRERPRKILLKGIPKSFPILKVKTELERLQFDIHRVSKLRNFHTKEPYPVL